MEDHKEMIICMKCGQINNVLVDQGNKLKKEYITCEECNNIDHITKYDFNPRKIKV